MMKQQTIGSLAEWVMKHRKGNAFKDDTLDNIVSGLQDDIANNNLTYVLDDTGEPIGLMTFLPDSSNKLLFVKNILVTKHTALKIFAQHFLQNFDGWTITGNRNDEQLFYSAHRLINLLTSQERNH